MLRQAEACFEALKLHNITTRLGDGGKGWPELAPFARIIVTAAAPAMPQSLAEQLDDGGSMVVPVGTSGEQVLYRITRQGQELKEERLLDVRFVPLVEGMPPSRA